MERQVELSRPDDRGISLYEHLAAAYGQTGKWPEEYEPLEPPFEASGVWDIFWELRQTAASGFGGPCRISFLEIDAWQRLRGVKLGNQIIDLLLEMDAAYMGAWAKAQSGKSRKTGASRTKKPAKRK